MKTLLLFLSLAGSAAAQSTGGPWAIKSSTLDGGGGVSTGGVWKVTGTIAQADATAGKSTGGTWSEQGGFWHDGRVVFNEQRHHCHRGERQSDVFQ